MLANRPRGRRGVVGRHTQRAAGGQLVLELRELIRRGVDCRQPIARDVEDTPHYVTTIAMRASIVCEIVTKYLAFAS